MIILEQIAALRAQVSAWKRAGQRVAFVPTMGNLHAGHISLIALAQQHAERVVCSIFVNPLQFGAGEDFATYPRTLDADSAQLRAAGTDLLFVPDVQTIYPVPAAQQTLVTVPLVSDILCGQSRPGHFTGVATVVCKLLNMVQPDVAVFGEKDFQQLHVIRRMVNELSLPVTIIGGPIARDADGLALSSRNGYLNQDERRCAPVLYASLQRMASRLSNAALDVKSIAAAKAEAVQQLEKAGFVLDYIEVRDAESLLEPDTNTKQHVILAAAYLGTTRLIDNLLLPRTRSA